MEVPGTDLISQDAYESDLRQQVSRSMDLTFIFNRHRDSTDAEETVSEIEPDSVVFIEGLTAQEGVPATFSHELTHLSRQRLIHGKAHPTYQQLKQDILDAALQQITCPSTSETDISQHVLHQIQLLLQKDCIVRYADYAESNAQNDQMSQFDEQFRKLFHDVSRYKTEEVNLNSNIAKIYSSIHKQVSSRYAMHYYREFYAFSEVIFFYTKLIQRHEYTTDLNLTPTGKIKTYITYGSAHSESLPTKFEEAGFEFEKVEIFPVKRHQLIDRTPEYFRENRPRRIAYHALASLPVAIEYLEVRELYTKDELVHLETEHDQQQSELYESLSTLNDNPDAVLKFVIRCIQIRQLNEIDLGRGLQLTDDLRTETLALRPKNIRHSKPRMIGLY